MGTIGNIVVGWVVLGTICALSWMLVSMVWRMRRLEERNAAQAATIAGLQKRLRHDEMPDMREVEKAWDRMLAASQRSGPRCPEPSPTNEIRSIWDKQARAEETAEILRHEAVEARTRSILARRESEKVTREAANRPWCPACHQTWKPGEPHECAAAQAHGIWNMDAADAESVRKVKNRLFGNED